MPFLSLWLFLFASFSQVLSYHELYGWKCPKSCCSKPWWVLSICSLVPKIELHPGWQVHGSVGSIMTSGRGAFCRGKRKKFPDVLGLVQHSKKITKTKKLLEHGGYACAIRYLLGWDSLGPPQFASHFSILAPRGCIPPADSPCSLLEKPGSQVVSSYLCEVLM